jgi:glycerol uptake facilitator-like aquaporin
VSLAMRLRGAIDTRTLAAYVAAQVAGALAGV